MKLFLCALLLNCAFTFAAKADETCKFTISYADQVNEAESLTEDQVAEWVNTKTAQHEQEAAVICQSVCAKNAKLSSNLEKNWFNTPALCEWRGGCIKELMLSLKTTARCVE